MANCEELLYTVGKLIYGWRTMPDKKQRPAQMQTFVQNL